MARDQLYLAHQVLIERVFRSTARRHRCDADEAEDFAAWARLKLVENDYAILGEFEGRAGLGTYLAVVVQRLFLDYRVSKWGKWRPCAEAKRLGPLAVRLETLLSRDGLTLEEAFQTMHAADRELRREALEDLVARLPVRVPRRFVGEGALESLAGAEPAPDERALEKETNADRRRSSAALAELLRQLDPQDQIVLRLRFAEGMPIADIARSLHLAARPLYRRIERLIKELRRGLNDLGISGDDLGWPVVPNGKATPRGRLNGE